jgi:hypothetical protein
MNRKIFAANDNNPLPKKKRAKSRDTQAHFRLSGTRKLTMWD